MRRRLRMKHLLRNHYTEIGDEQIINRCKGDDVSEILTAEPIDHKLSFP
jgi:hypothetical protein